MNLYNNNEIFLLNMNISLKSNTILTCLSCWRTWYWIFSLDTFTDCFLYFLRISFFNLLRIRCFILFIRKCFYLSKYLAWYSWFLECMIKNALNPYAFFQHLKSVFRLHNIHLEFCTCAKIFRFLVYKYMNNN